MDLHEWAMLSTILLACEGFVLLLIPLAAFYFGVRGMSKLTGLVRMYGPKVQGYFRKSAVVADQVSQRIASPFIASSAAITQARRMLAALSPRDRREV